MKVFNQLSKAEMKNVLGGVEEGGSNGTCIIKASDGHTYNVPGDGTSQPGQDACAGYIAIHGGRCHYDCSYDGVG